MKVRYKGNGQGFLYGYPANPHLILKVGEKEGEQLLKSGLYEEIREEKKEESKIKFPLKEELKGDDING